MIEDQRLVVEELQTCTQLLRSFLENGAPPKEPVAEPGSALQPLAAAATGTADLLADARRLRHLGREAVQTSIALRLRSQRSREDQGRLRAEGRALSRREREVLALIVQGKTSRQIAATLGISFKTAVTHRSSIMDKMDVHHTASLVREAIRQGLF